MVPEIRPPQCVQVSRKGRRIALLIAGLAVLWAVGVVLVGYAALRRAVLFNPSAGWVDSRRLKLEPFAKPMLSDNGFDTYQEAIALLPQEETVDLGSGPVELVSEYAKGTVSLSGVRATLIDAQPALDKVHEAALKDYASPGPLTIDARYPWCAEQRELARFVAADARAKHEQGQDAAALMRCRDGTAMGVHIGTNGTMIEKLVGIAVEAIVYGPAVQTITSGDLPASELKAHGAEVRRIREQEHPLSEVARAEFEVCRDAAYSIGRPERRQALLDNGFDAEFLRAMNSPVIRLTWSPEVWLEWVEDRCARTVEEWSKLPSEADLEAFDDQMLADTRARNDPLAMMVAPSAAKLWWKHVHGDLLLIAQETIAGIRAYDVERGHLPQALSDLVPGYLPEVPVDPFDGEPLRYRESGSDYVLYSVGKDKRDDGGTAGYVIGKDVEPDMILYPLPPPTTTAPVAVGG